jgi:hypothetical protein
MTAGGPGGRRLRARCLSGHDRGDGPVLAGLRDRVGASPRGREGLGRRLGGSPAGLTLVQAAKAA